uniref:BMERB domain-containing protein n=1 Tax=Plectus sambesii TaxID=2011161 RepID=A0A914WZ52_9BILA
MDSAGDVRARLNRSNDSAASEREIKKIQRAAERIVRQNEQNRQRKGQDIQRRLQEVEVRRAEVDATGAELEKRLTAEPENRWVLEQWLLFVNEREQLDRLETDLSLRAQEVELENKHSMLQTQLKAQMTNVHQTSKDDIESQRRLLDDMLKVVEQRDTLVSQMERERLKDKQADKHMKDILDKKGYSYANFGPVFLADGKLTSLV